MRCSMNKNNDGLQAKQNIANVIRNLREKNGYTQKDIGNITGKAHTTVASWESGKSQPDIDTLMQLCLMYDVDDVLAEFEYRERINGITDNEQELIKAYRNLSEASKDLMLKLAANLINVESSLTQQSFLAVARGNGNATAIDGDGISALKPRNWNED